MASIDWYFPGDTNNTDYTFIFPNNTIVLKGSSDKQFELEKVSHRVWTTNTYSGKVVVYNSSGVKIFNGSVKSTYVSAGQFFAPDCGSNPPVLEADEEYYIGICYTGLTDTESSSHALYYSPATYNSYWSSDEDATFTINPVNAISNSVDAFPTVDWSGHHHYQVISAWPVAADQSATVTPSAIARTVSFPGRIVSSGGGGGSGALNILLVVNDDGAGIAQSANDGSFKSTLEGRGHTVTYGSETSTLPNSGYDVIVITESGSGSSNAQTSIPTCSLPVITFETTWTHTRLTSSDASSSGVSTTNVDLVGSHSINTGHSDPLTLLNSASAAYGVTSIASGAVSLGVAPGSSYNVAVVADTGATLTSGTAPNRRGAVGLLDSRLGNMTSAGIDWVEDIITWAANVSVGGGTDVTVTAETVSASTSFPAATVNAAATGGGGGTVQTLNILLVANDDGSGVMSSAGDNAFYSFLESRNHIIDWHSERQALPNIGYDVIVITESGSASSAAHLSVPNCTLPVVYFETSWANTRLASSSAVSSGTSGTTIDLGTHDINTGFPDPLTAFGSSSTNYGALTANLASGAESIATIPGTSHTFAVVAEQGATLTTGTAVARRACVGLTDGRIGQLTLDGRNWIEEVLYWASGISASTPDAFVSPSIFVRNINIPTPAVRDGNPIGASVYPSAIICRARVNVPTTSGTVYVPDTGGGGGGPGAGGTLKAFPGAMGWGANSVGGRGGTIIKVTNLNDSGPGSLRAAVEQDGPRTVVFTVGGTINLNTRINVIGASRSYLTIAGQTAPGDGITLRLAPGATTDQGTMTINGAHDIIIRYVRFRPGPTPNADDSHDCITMYQTGTYNIMLDHCSFSWAVDECVNTYDASYNITVQNCIISEGLSNAGHPDGEHSKGMLAGGAGASKISILRNLFVNNKDRNPQVSGLEYCDVRNNVIYNYGTGSGSGVTLISSSKGEPRINWVGNYYKPGPSSDTGRAEFALYDGSTGATHQWYGTGNKRWTSGGDSDARIYGTASSRQVGTPFPNGDYVETLTAAQALLHVMETAGASLVRDAVDERIVNSFYNNTGQIINNPTEVGGWPSLSSGTPWTDSNNNGMSDAAETAYGSGPNNDSDSDGWTNIEEWFADLAADVDTGTGGGGTEVPPVAPLIVFPSTIYATSSIPYPTTTISGGSSVWFVGPPPILSTVIFGASTTHEDYKYTPPPIFYTEDLYRAQFTAGQTRITRRIEILDHNQEIIWDDDRLISGNVSVDYNRDERRSGEFELGNFDKSLVHRPEGFWYDKLLRVYRGIEFTDHTGVQSKEYQLGLFMIDRVTQPRFPSTVKVTARDLTKKLLLSKFTSPIGYSTGTSIETVIETLAWRGGITNISFPNTGEVLGTPIFFEQGKSRWECMKEVATAFGYELYFDAYGILHMRLFQDPTTGTVTHTFETGPSVGNLVDWEKTTNDSRVYNHIFVTGADADNIPVYAEAYNDNPFSPTNRAKLGDRVFHYQNSLMTTTAQCQALAEYLLAINALEEYEINMQSLVLPWLEAGDIVRFIDPEAHTTADPSRFLLTNFNIPIGLEAMSATGRRVTIVS